MTIACVDDASVASTNLERGAPAAKRYACSIYADRPQACRDFEAGGRHCLDARRRVGLSR